MTLVVTCMIVIYIVCMYELQWFVTCMIVIYIVCMYE